MFIKSDVNLKQICIVLTSETWFDWSMNRTLHPSSHQL